MKERGVGGSGTKRRSLAPFSSSSMSSSHRGSSSGSSQASDEFQETSFKVFEEQSKRERSSPDHKKKKKKAKATDNDVIINDASAKDHDVISEEELVSVSYNGDLNIQNTDLNIMDTNSYNNPSIDNDGGDDDDNDNDDDDDDYIDANADDTVYFDKIDIENGNNNNNNEDENEETNPLSPTYNGSVSASNGALGKINMPVAITPILHSARSSQARDDDFYNINTTQFNSPPVVYMSNSKSSPRYGQSSSGGGSSERQPRKSRSSSNHRPRNSFTASNRTGKYGRSSLATKRSDIPSSPDGSSSSDDDEDSDSDSDNDNKNTNNSNINNGGPDRNNYLSESDATFTGDSMDTDSFGTTSKSAVRKVLKKIKDRVIHPSFTTMYSIMIYVCVAIFVFVTLVNIQDSGDMLLKEQLEKKYRNISIEHRLILDLRLENIEGVARALADEAPLSVYRNTTERKSFMGYLSFFVGNYSDCSAVMLSRPNGNLYQIINFKNGRYSRVYPTVPGGLEHCEFSTDESGDVIHDVIECRDDYNVTDKEWYKSVNTSIKNDYAWKGPIRLAYVYYTFSVASFHTKSNASYFSHVITTSLLVENVSSILKTEINDEGSLSFIVDTVSESFIGSTDPDIEIGSRENSTNNQIVKIFNVSEIDDANVLDANKIVLDRYGSWGNVAEDVFWAGEGDQKRVLSITRIDRKGLSWAVVTIASPTTKVMETRTLCLVIFVCFLCGIFITGLSLEIIRPVSVLAGDMKRVATLEDMDMHCKTNKRHISKVKEIGSLQLSFLKLRTGIIALTKYVAAPVIRIVMKDCINLKPQMKRGDVTILFVDIAESTTLIERIQNANLYSILSTWFREFGTIVEKNGGIIDKFIGDSIMALYGAPDRLRNKEKAACATAVEFHDAAKRANKVAKRLAKRKNIEHVKLRYRVGIHTGPVYVGHIGYEGHINYTACGNTVNVANTMEQLGKLFNLTPLITGEVEKRVNSEFISVFLCVITLPGYEKTKERVYHLVGKRENAQKKSLEIAEGFDRVHGYIEQGKTEEAKKLIEKLKSDSKFKKYIISLDVILHRIDNGALTQEMYS